MTTYVVSSRPCGLISYPEMAALQGKSESRTSFPQNPEEFDADARVSFSKLDQKYILEADDGQEYEFDEALKRWVPVVRLYPPTSHL